MSRSGFNFNNLRNLFIIEVARKYFEETSIHGLKYITEPNRTLVERVCWVIFITVSCSVAGYLIYSVCGKLCKFLWSKTIPLTIEVRSVKSYSTA